MTGRIAPKALGWRWSLKTRQAATVQVGTGLAPPGIQASGQTLPWQEVLVLLLSQKQPLNTPRWLLLVSYIAFLCPRNKILLSGLVYVFFFCIFFMCIDV